MHYYQMSLVICFALFCLSYNLPAAISLLCRSTKEVSGEVTCDGDNSCYTKIENDDITRGCTTTTDMTCAEPSCVKCKEEKCNTQTICKSCNGMDADCSQTEASDGKYNKICDKSSQYCITKVGGDKTLSRGCASEQEKTECDKESETCATCSGDKCNKGIFPSGRLRCYQCDECNDIGTTISTKPCFFYEKEDSCYTFGSDDKTMKRGCKSDKESKCNGSDIDDKCSSCKGDGCNRLAYSRKQALTCLQCADETTCAQKQDPKKAKDCTKEILFYQEEYCYTQSKSGLVHRGCYNERPTDFGNCEDGSACKKCNSGSGCNSDETEFTCLRCRSDVQPECSDEVDKISGQKCTNATEAAALGCYHGIWNGVVIRGCMNDADIRMQYQCTNDQDKTCTQCVGIDCNNKKTNDAAGGLRLSVILFNFLLIIGCALR